MTTRIRKTNKAYIGSIGDQLPQENVFVTVKRVDNNIHEPRNLSLELKLLRIAANRSLRDRLRLPEMKFILCFKNLIKDL